MKDPHALQEALAKIDPTVATFRAAVAATDRSYYVELLADLENAITACAAFEEILDEKFGKEAPSYARSKTAFRKSSAYLARPAHASRRDRNDRRRRKHRLFSRTGEPEFELWAGGPIRSRADAYRRLSDAAEYLLRTEPHSPTPYLVKRAVEWGTMTLPELLQQIVRNEGELNEIDRLLRLTGKRWPT
jgi:type VI secretion system protein ImpA